MRMLHLLGMFGLLALVVMNSSCNIAAPIAIALDGPPTREAEFTLPPDRSLAVFVDDRRNVLGDRSLERYLGDKIIENLMRQQLFAEENVPIRTRDVLAVVNGEKLGELLPLGEIGRRVGAEVLIYVEMLTFRLIAEAEQPRAQASLQVKVLDVVNEVKLFPSSGSRAMLVDLPSEIAFQTSETRASAREAELALANEIAEKIAKLFYEHEIRAPLGSRSGPTAAYGD